MLLPITAGARSALVIVDMQEFFFRKPERRQHLDTVIANINQLIDYFEAWQWPIAHVITCYKADGSDWELKMKATGEPELIAGMPETAILPQIKTSDAHFILAKTRYSAFFKTNLADRLRASDVQRVVVVGAYTYYCVNATVFDAYCDDFVPAIVTDAVTSHLEDESAVMIARTRRNDYHVMSTRDSIGEER
jgi:nicotinamidase-related amidase